MERPAKNLFDGISRIIPRSSKYSKSTVISQSLSETKSLGLAIFAEGADPIVDIVALHGLNGHREKTWTAANDVLWLRDLLPTDLPNARIFSWGYNADVFGGTHGIDQQHIYDHGRTLISDLCLKRRLTKTQRRPIIFIAHSLGGIVVKSALIHSDAARNGALEDHKAIALSTYGIVFMGTPHQGGNGVALGRAIINIASIFVKADSKFIKNLERDSQLLHQQLGQFATISNQFTTKFAYETLPTPTAFGKSMIIVPIGSAMLPGVADAEAVAIMADHRNMVRFLSRDDNGYEKISGHLLLMMEDAAIKVDHRWETDDEQKRVVSGKVKKITINMLKDMSNSYFTGRQEELAKLRQYMTAENSVKRRQAVIWGIGGAGKTEVAVNYALQYSQDFSAIFFVNAKDTTEIRRGYADIASHLGLSEAVGKELAETDVAAQVAAIEAVKSWLRKQEKGDWLLIIDNADDLDGVSIEEYIPHGNKGHIILTSQDRGAANFCPATIELGEMKKEDAEALFLQKACITNPTKEQMTVCTEIVNKLGRLALAVEHAGAYVHNNDMASRPEDYLMEFEKRKKEVLEESPRFSRHKSSMMATYMVTRTAIIKRNIKAQYLLAWISALDGTAVPESLLVSKHVTEMHKYWNQDYSDDFDDAKKVLLSYSLIQIRRTEQGAFISMHGLVHQCVQARLSQVDQWRWIHFSSYILFTLTKANAFERSHFSHVKHVLETVKERLKQPENGPPSTEIWFCLTFLMHSHIVMWKDAGLMQELHMYSIMVMDSLENTEDTEYTAITLGVAANVRGICGAYSNLEDEVHDLCLRQYLKKQMTPSAMAALKQIEDGTRPATTFNQSCLKEIYRNPSPNLTPLLSELTRAVAAAYVGRGKPELSSLYYRISHLPLESTWKSWVSAFLMWLLTYIVCHFRGTPMPEALESQQVLAARDRLAGNIQSTMVFFRQTIAQHTPGDLNYECASFELFRLLMKQGETEEAAAVVDKLMYPSVDLSEADIARMHYKDMYVWMRKLKVMLLLQDHATHGEAKAYLVRILETTEMVFGPKSLSTVHATLLLEIFHRQPCCYDEAIGEAYKEKKEEMFKLLYGTTPAVMRRQEGLRMGKELLRQGALEEAGYVIRMFARMASEELGDDDPTTVEAKRLLGVAEKEMAEELEDEKGGRSRALLNQLPDLLHILREQLQVPPTALCLVSE
ncbi:hypothetical protein V501_03683 [Pseudogymnoascus sp. VKM F-4519 (FW-2642)]|nr:hypothetical protein V501_03683 [Pseudogymnoascus sp. VKM F-4519 (FW-2642)]